MNEPKFDREVKTRPLDEFDYEILKDGVMHVDENGNEHVPTLEELNNSGMSRVTSSRDIMTGQWCNKEDTGIPFYVTKVNRY